MKAGQARAGKRSPHVALALTAGMVMASCGSHGASETLGQSAAAISFGTADTTHTAVVALLGKVSSTTFDECTGSIVQISGGEGYVLTAAHCCNNVAPAIVVAADDYSVGEAYLSGGTPTPPSYAVVAGSVYFDASYSGQDDHDFCMLKFAGATAGMATLSLPSSTADGLALDVAVEHIGYGQTETSATNTVRRASTDTVDQMLTPLLLEWSQAGAGNTPGVCEGDSGGPALLPAGMPQAQQTIVATTSHGNNATCSQATSAGGSRVSSETGPGGFITSYLAGTPIGLAAGSPAALCDTCAQNSETGACMAQATACSGDPACATLSTCVQGCTTSACSASCSTTAGATAVEELNAFDACICNTACGTQCATECATPDGGASCGISSSVATCTPCINASCCAQAEACVADATCAGCLVASPPASCSSDTLLGAFTTCVDTSCATQCGTPDAGMSAAVDGGHDAGMAPVDSGRRDATEADTGSELPNDGGGSVDAAGTGSGGQDSGREHASEGGASGRGSSGLGLTLDAGPTGTPGQSSGCSLGGAEVAGWGDAGVLLVPFLARRRRPRRRT